MFGRGFCEKYQSRDEKFPEPKGEENLVSRLVFFANTPPNMIYLFNYTEYYLEHWLNKYYNTLCLSFSVIFCFYCVFFRNVLTCYKPFEEFLFLLFFYVCSKWIWRFEAREGKKVKYVFANTTEQREKKLNPHANTPAAVKMTEINPKYENTRKIHQLLTNRNPGFLYKV